MAVSALTLDRLCIHQVTLMQCDFRASIECFSRHGVRRTAVWRDKLDEFGLSEAVRILKDQGVSVDALCPGGLMTAESPTDFREAIDRNRIWLDLAAELGAQSMVTITGGLPDGHTDLSAARQRALEGLAELVPHARAVGVKLALEPLHPMVCGVRSVISTIGDAMEMLDELDADDIAGLAIDSYAVWWDRNLQAELARAGSRILHFHASDWLPDTEDLRFDRGMPGDGMINNPQIRGWMEQIGFHGPVEVEIFSHKNWWKQAPDDVVLKILERMERSL